MLIIQNWKDKKLVNHKLRITIKIPFQVFNIGGFLHSIKLQIRYIIGYGALKKAMFCYMVQSNLRVGVL